MRVGSIRNIGLALAISVVAALAFCPVYAGSSSQAAQPAGATGIGNWQPIDSSWVEYDFVHHGGDAPVQILVSGDPPNSVAFKVYTDGQWKSVTSGNLSENAVGQGTANSYEPADLFYQGSSQDGGLYHVIVFQVGVQSGPTRFWISTTAASGGSALTLVSALPTEPASSAGGTAAESTPAATVETRPITATVTIAKATPVSATKVVSGTAPVATSVPEMTTTVSTTTLPALSTPVATSTISTTTVPPAPTPITTTTVSTTTPPAASTPITTAAITQTTPLGLTPEATAAISAATPPAASAGVATSEAGGGALSATLALTATAVPTEAARTGIGNWQWIAGAPMEFDFTHKGGNAPTQLLVSGLPPNCVGFTVYTDSQWRSLAGGDLTVSALGKGTTNLIEPSDLFWQGGTSDNGLFHVQVFQVGPNTAPAKFWIGEPAASGAGPLIPLSPPAVVK